jgi:hypothetical protein
LGYLEVRDDDPAIIKAVPQYAKHVTLAVVDRRTDFEVRGHGSVRKRRR